MRMIYCTGNIEILENFKTFLEQNEVKKYQIIDRVLAQSETGVPRFDTSVWPGYNFSIFIQIKDEEKAQEIMKKIAGFNEELRRENDVITYFSWEIDKFSVD